MKDNRSHDPRHLLSLRHDAFLGRAAALGLRPDPRWFWYHTIDLGRGLVTPGSFDYRAVLPRYGFPERLDGRRALDVGAASGFFSLALAARGAAVTACEVPGFADWDHFPGEAPGSVVEKIRGLLAHHTLWSQPEVDRLFAGADAALLHDLLLEQPFAFACEASGLPVRRLHATWRTLDRALAGEPRFDLVLLADVLPHVVDPLAALAAVAAWCGDRLVVAQELWGPPEEPPLLRYIGGDRPGEDVAEWWRPTYAWFAEVLAKLGFREVRLLDRFETLVYPAGHLQPKTVIQARR
jgi:hypothetical protein